MNDIHFAVRYILSFLAAIVGNAFFSILPLAALCFVFVLLDCLTAWRLSRRVRATYGDDKASGKFQSDKFGHTVVKFTIIIPLALILAYWSQELIFVGTSIDCIKITAGAFIGWLGWSCLENESSCNGKRWARLLQTIMIDKAERHLDVNLSELKNNINSSNHEKEDNQKDSQSQDCKQG